MDNVFRKTGQQVMEGFGVGLSGLTGQQVDNNRRQYGENALAEQKRQGVLAVFLSQFKDLMVAILVAAAVISMLSGSGESTIVIFAVLILNAVLGTVQHFKAEKSLDSLKALSAPTAKVMRDGEKKEIVPSVTGVSLDEEAAQALLSRTGEGEDCTLSLTFTEPETTTAGLEEVLFRDLLGSAESRVTGTAARISNVNIGQGYIDGTILMPDEVFSYMALVAPYSAERGFKPASVYAGGGSRDELGGGLCQVSSTLYLATLRANLEIVERYQHAYVVSYLPAGMDATIYSNRLDFKFKNTTGYPMRVDFRMEKRSDGYYWLVAELYGTKTDDT